MSYGELPIRYVRTFEAGGKSVRSDYYNPPPDAASYIIYKEGDLIKAKNGRTGQVEYKDNDAATVMQNVINNADPEGVKIYIKRGTYVISKTIHINKRFIIEGEGSGGNPSFQDNVGMTVLKLADNADCNMFELDPASSPPAKTTHYQLPVFKHLHFDGNKDDQTSNVSAIVQNVGSAVDIMFFDCWFDRWKGSPVILRQYWNHWFSRCTFEHNDDYAIKLMPTSSADVFNLFVRGCYFAETEGGIATENPQKSVKHIIVSENVFTGMWQPAINIEYAYNVIISNNIIRACSMEAIKIQGSYVIISNNRITDVSAKSSGTYHAINLYKASTIADLYEVIITGNQINGNNAKSCIGAEGSRVIDKLIITGNIFNTGSYCIYNDDDGQIRRAIITGNVFYDGTRTHNGIRCGKTYPMLILNNQFDKFDVAIALSDVSYKVQIVNNMFEGSSNTPVSDPQTQPSQYRAIIKHNVGYVTENSGTATFSGDGTTITFTIPHGLVSTPTTYYVEAASADAAGDKHVTADSTNLVVTFSAAPPAGTDNVVLKWHAEV
ncbi:MAG: hypothetical protein DRP01_09825 [Archaeoglobales archaeon]|nr:MAG: hypothetical protein DRP01_09825 [Archaeoglobales archaeon]